MQEILHTLIELLVRGIGVGFAASITVGPVAVIVIQKTLNKVSRGGFYSGLGVACADTLMAIIALFFYSMFEDFIEQYSVMLRVLGGILVIGIGIHIFLQNPERKRKKLLNAHLMDKLTDVDPEVIMAKSDGTAWGDFTSMFGITLANFVIVIPYVLAFFAVFGVGNINSGEVLPIFVGSSLIIVGFFIGAVAWWLALTALISIFRKRFRPHHMVAINHVAGSIVVILGIISILSIFYKIVPNVHGF